jgi:capsular exopolysaccharide synthesis family protein
MGRVYEALKRASDAKTGGANKKKSVDNKRRNGAGAGKPFAPVPPASNGEGEHPWDDSLLFAGGDRAAYDSASTAHTQERAGSALSGVTASRAAGATLDAAGAARAAEYMSLDITAARVEPHLIAITQPRSAYCEQFRSLRTRILQAGERRKMQAFVITSAGVAEGKTLTALNLSWLLAQTDGVRCLIIDSDLRQPCATDYLGIEASIGLSEVLSGEATLDETIIRLEPAGLYLLPGGEARDDVAEVLSGPKFGRILAELRRTFDYIVIDAPPLGIFTDANILINRADGALLVVRSGKTRYAALDRIIEQLPRERMLGVVLNRTDEQLDESSYYYQRRSYRREDKTASLPKAQAAMKEEGEVVSAT